ncbi:hypothetical protein [Paenibacillus sp. J22TS3]|uniref:hypothetical protein n=1 Tax=Paenibacillus sp. J22TS3 TaxID=2807192 RepID=UPI001AFDCC54|nr:hypothetical protein [Paenibacillus sp. J22TS3]GIP23493.1 hypothetical protein J22TS3_37680 [Paenibacillus sp. J22TS3]
MNLLKISLVLLFITLPLFGCSDSPSAASISIPEKDQAYLADWGYAVKDRLGNDYKYKLSRKQLAQQPQMMIWGLQKADPAEYVGNEVIIRRYIVSSPEQERKFQLKSGEMLTAALLIVRDKIVGGYIAAESQGESDKPTGNALYSLDGRTLEEVSGQDFSGWRENWLTKYSGSD